MAAALWGGLYAVSAGTFDKIPPITLNVLRLAVGLGVLLIAFRGRIGWAGRRAVACSSPAWWSR